jgi:hypothetical protein
VVEVKMGIDDVCDFGGMDSGGAKGCGKTLVILVDRAHLCGLLVADAGFDEDGGVRGSDDGGVEAEEEVVIGVGWGALGPKGLRNDAEHGAAVQEEGAVRAEGDFEVTHKVAATDEFVV